MANEGLLTNVGEEPVENELPDPPPEENKGIYAGGSTRTAMSVVVVDDGPTENEIPDPPPEENKG